MLGFGVLRLGLVFGLGLVLFFFFYRSVKILLVVYSCAGKVIVVEAGNAMRISLTFSLIFIFSTLILTALVEILLLS